MSETDLQKRIDAVEAELATLRGPEPPGLSDADRQRRAANLAALLAERAALQARMGQADGDEGHTPPWVRQDDGSYRLSDGRTCWFAIGSQLLTVDSQGRAYVVVGLTDPARPGAGVQIVRETDDPEARAEAERRVQALARKRRESGLTAAEAAELNRLQAALAGTTVLTLGIPGAGSYRLESELPRDREGREVISVMGTQHQLHAPITGIQPNSEAEWAALAAWLHEREQALVREKRDLEARIAWIEGGAA